MIGASVVLVVGLTVAWLAWRALDVRRLDRRLARALDRQGRTTAAVVERTAGLFVASLVDSIERDDGPDHSCADSPDGTHCVHWWDLAGPCCYCDRGSS